MYIINNTINNLNEHLRDFLLDNSFYKNFDQKKTTNFFSHRLVFSSKKVMHPLPTWHYSTHLYHVPEPGESCHQVRQTAGVLHYPQNKPSPSPAQTLSRKTHHFTISVVSMHTLVTCRCAEMTSRHFLKQSIISKSVTEENELSSFYSPLQLLLLRDIPSRKDGWY